MGEGFILAHGLKVLVHGWHVQTQMWHGGETCCGGKLFMSWWLGSREKARGRKEEQGVRYTISGHTPIDMLPPPP